MERHPPVGILVIDPGSAKLSASASNGKRVIAKVGQAVEVLGLSAESGKPYETTAVTPDPRQISARISFAFGKMMCRFVSKPPNS